MKKLVLLTAFLSCLLITACGRTSNAGEPAVEQEETVDSAESSDEVLEIKEKLFIAQTNDIYLNPENYLGMRIRYEGIYDPFEYENLLYHYVIRYGPGCCGYDANAGFEVAWEGLYPEAGAWVEAEGVLEMYESEGSSFLLLKLDHLEEKAERGAEFVFQ